MSPARLPIGIFDSGIGGLTVVRQIHRVLPREDLIYLGDTARVPYGTKSPETVRRSNDKAECYALLHEIGVPAPAFRRVRGAEAVAEAARELGYPERPVCFKPVFGSGSRGFRVKLDQQGDMRARIKAAQERKSSYMLIVGDKEAAAGTVSVRRRGSRDEERGVTLDAFLERVSEERDSKALPADFVGHREPSAGDAMA